ncbi:MAG: glycosyltransferase [Plesiomonas sp.]|uniref:glycosyltransferase n=1 Tax=Plesiomonas sp. TaxID=2486279 RepID=UPI003F3D098A
MKKLVFFINSLGIGGAEKVLLAYVRSLVTEYGYQVTVVTNENSENCYLCDEVKRYANYYYLERPRKFNIPVFSKMFHSLMKAFLFLNVIRKNDVLIDFLDGDFYKKIRFFNKRRITWLHSSFINLNERKRNMECRCKCYDDIIMICNDMRDEIIKLNPDWIDNVSVIYNPFDFKFIHNKSLDESDVLENERTIISSDFILTVCRLDEQTKDVTGLLKAYALALSNGLKYKLVIIGDGVDKSILEKKAQELNISDKVFFLGLKSNPYIWMRHAKSFVLSSKGEGFGLVLVEALYLTGSVISTDCPVGPSEILERGNLGGLYPLGDYHKLSQLLLSPPEKIKNIDLLKYSKENSVKSLVSLIESPTL